MKIIQSFWTKPMLKTISTSCSDRFSGGWLNETSHYLSWALSCLQLKKYYKRVELYTDELGKEILIDQFRLPYTDVHVVLDEINHYNPDLWAMGKVTTYGMQTEPFIHIDSDVYIGARFPNRIENAGLVTQNMEKGFSFYSGVYNSLTSNNFSIPSVISKRSGPLIAYNAGILGGTDIPFIKEYVAEAKRFVNTNLDKIAKVDAGRFNCIYEQLLLYYMAVDKSINVECLFNLHDASSLDKLLKDYNSFIKAPAEVKYVHLFGEDCKKDENYCIELANKMQNLYPEYYYRITLSDLGKQLELSALNLEKII